MQVHCPKCGVETREGDKYCSSCGANVHGEPFEQGETLDDNRVACPKCKSISVLPVKKKYHSREARIQCLKCGEIWSVKAPMTRERKLLLLAAGVVLLIVFINLCMQSQNTKEKNIPVPAKKTSRSHR